MVSNCFSWLRISNDSEDTGFYYDILSCLGDMILDICNTEFYSEKEKIDYIERMFFEYCRLKTNSQSEELRSKIGDTIIKPSQSIKNHNPYYMYVSKAWSKFDKIPHRSGMGTRNDKDNPYFKQLKNKVIIPLGLDPDMY